jgi:hypothetical protein
MPDTKGRLTTPTLNPNASLQLLDLVLQLLDLVRFQSLLRRLPRPERYLQ